MGSNQPPIMNLCTIFFTLIATAFAAQYQGRYLSTIKSQHGYVVPGAHSAVRSSDVRGQYWWIDPVVGTISTLENLPRYLNVVLEGRFGDSLTLSTAQDNRILDTMKFDIVQTGVIREGEGEVIRIRSRASPNLFLDADTSSYGDMMMWPENGSPQQNFTQPETLSKGFYDRVWGGM